ncbi:hypothetical protein [Tenacibaculum jejuense]|uniref:Uncharacterized protein n=1 Tax=Tenacibaculum jejuense TaxID=584609 RepID=A0A238U407_9FLAO|nr:hypothetical protein [Tenacibaculum jejuense]SNR13867.1 protein of unknown function [Tenacibaculum jejuense]
MEATEIFKQIENVLHKDNLDVIFAVTDTSVSDKQEEGIVPYLNIYGCSIMNDHNFDLAYKKAIQHDDLGYLVEILRYRFRSDFHIK